MNSVNADDVDESVVVEATYRRPPGGGGGVEKAHNGVREIQLSINVQRHNDTRSWNVHVHFRLLFVRSVRAPSA